MLKPVSASILTTSISIAFGTSALAQDATPGDASAIVSLACNDPGRSKDSFDFVDGTAKWKTISGERLAFFLLAATGEMASPGEAVSKIRAVSGESLDVSPIQTGRNSDAIWVTAREVSNVVSPDSNKVIAAFDRSGRRVSAAEADQLEAVDAAWYLSAGITLACYAGQNLAGEGPTTAGATTAEKPRISLGDFLRLRGNVTDLALSGERRKKASAGTVGFERIKNFKADGTRTETETLSIKAVLGAPLIQRDDRFFPNVLGYVGYERKSARTTPPPVLIPPATQRDGDTDILKLGLIGGDIIDLSGKGPENQRSFLYNIDASYIFDFAKDTERFKAELTGTFFDYDGFDGFAGIGGYRNYLAKDIWTRIDFQPIVNYNILTKEGTLSNIGKETFAHAGAIVKFSATRGKTQVNGPFLSAEYINLRRIRGDGAFIPNVERHEFVIGHRWWTLSDFGLEISAKLLDGINPDSFADENQVSIGFGLIF